MTTGSSPGPNPASSPSHAQIRRWRRYLADELAEGQLYANLAQRTKDPQKERILRGLAQAETRHAEHWRRLLPPGTKPAAPSFSRSILRFLAKHFGVVFVLALAQRAESTSPYTLDPDATASMAADEQIHEEVIRGLANEGRLRLSGSFRAAVFGANDGLVSNLALVLGIAATGVSTQFVVFSGFAGLLAGALSMGAGEYVSVRSQRELVEATHPTHATLRAAPDLDLNENELVLVYLARGMTQEAAEHRAAERMGRLDCDCDPSTSLPPGMTEDEVLTASGEPDTIGSALGASVASFCSFSVGALVAILPFLFGLSGTAGLITAAVLVGLVLLVTGGIVGILSGTSPFTRGLRQLAIGLGAAAVTYVLGLLFGASP